MMRFLALLMTVALLSGCGSMSFWGSDDADELAPAELLDIDQEINIDKLWSRGVGAGQDELFSSLSASLVNGVIYAADPKGKVVAISAADGRVLWNQNLKRSVSGGVG